MVPAQEITTAQQLLEASNLGPCELLRGRLVIRSYTGWEHGLIVSHISVAIGSFTEERSLGAVLGARTGFQIGHNPDTVRTTDVAFVRVDRVPPPNTTGYYQGPPDLAIEVMSPSVRAGELMAKVQDWLAAGCRVVWVVDPTSQTVSIYRSSREMTLLTVADELTDDEILPGFCLPVAEIF